MTHESDQCTFECVKKLFTTKSTTLFLDSTYYHRVLDDYLNGQKHTHNFKLAGHTLLKTLKQTGFFSGLNTDQTVFDSILEHFHVPIFEQTHCLTGYGSVQCTQRDT